MKIRHEQQATTYIVISVGIGIELSVSVRLADVHILVPPLQYEVGVVPEIAILTSDTTINLEHAVLSQAQGGSKGVGNAIVRTADGVLAADKITAGKQTDSGKED